MEAAVVAQEDLPGPGVLEAGDCSEPWKWEAFEV